VAEHGTAAGPACPGPDIRVNCSVAVPAGRISRIDADGIFRQSMRELGVPFLRRWIMWAAGRIRSVADVRALGRLMTRTCAVTFAVAARLVYDTSLARMSAGQ
jgi:Protein of unknown function (DUF1353)